VHPEFEESAEALLNKYHVLTRLPA
jgi:hypothetical protein